MEPNPRTPQLQQLRERVEQVVGIPFNSVLLNLYRDQNDSVGWHSDNEPELGANPTIASVSLGEQRDFLLRHRTNPGVGKQRVPLTHGSLLIMSGQTQGMWQHAIAKHRHALEPRINLTFRRIEVQN
jgi:alkylated DNA repair dioxygenase AlkB